MGEDKLHQPETEIRRAPSAVSLLCISCRRRVTPCLVCAHLLPCCSCSGPLSWLECRKCSLKNPLGDQERRTLGFPPALALPSSMVRRVLIAHIGRPLSMVATHLYLQHIQQVLSAKQSEDASGGQVFANRRDFYALEENISSRFPRAGLPFLQSDGILMSFVPPVRKQSVNANNENQILVEANQDVDVSCIDCSRSCNCAVKFGDDITREALRRCQEQLVAMQCAEAFSTDLNCSAYPVCNTLMKSSLSIQETRTCNSSICSDCSLGMGKGCTVDMLHVVSSIFAKDFEIWLAEKLVASGESYKFEDILRHVEAFKGNQDHLINLQRSMLRAVAAQKQVAIDIKVDPSHSMLCMLEQLFEDRMKERMEKISRIAESYHVLLEQINLVLEFLYTRTHAAMPKLHSFPLCTQIDHVLECNDSFPNKGQLQMAVSYWLLLYHDIAHAISVI